MVGWKCLDQWWSWSHPDFVTIVLLLMPFQLSGQRSDFMSIFNETFKNHDVFLNCWCPRQESNCETRLPGSTPSLCTEVEAEEVPCAQTPLGVNEASLLLEGQWVWISGPASSFKCLFQKELPIQVLKCRNWVTMGIAITVVHGFHSQVPQFHLKQKEKIFCERLQMWACGCITVSGYSQLQLPEGPGKTVQWVKVGFFSN